MVVLHAPTGAPAADDEREPLPRGARARPGPHAYCHSVGLDDCLLRPRAAAVARRIVERSVADALDALAAEAADRDGAGAGRRPPPYRVDETRGALERLNAVRTESERYVVDHVMTPRARRPGVAGGATTLSQTNAIAVLCMLGTKGSVTNLLQCTHALWQQPRPAPAGRWAGAGRRPTIHETRVPRGDFGRVFPHDPRDTDRPESRGLLHRESFIEGLTPQAFFIHAMAGRECLVEGATSTARPARPRRPRRGRAAASRATPCGWASR